MGLDTVYTPGKPAPIGQEQPSIHTPPQGGGQGVEQGGQGVEQGGQGVEQGGEQPVEDTSMVLCLPVNTQGFEDARGDQMSITTQAIMKKGVRVSHET